MTTLILPLLLGLASVHAESPVPCIPACPADLVCYQGQCIPPPYDFADPIRLGQAPTPQSQIALGADIAAS